MADEELDDVVEQFSKNGYAVLEDLLSAEECELLRERSKHYVDLLDVSTHPKSVFSTENQKIDEYFLTSEDKIRYFFEDGVFDDKGNLNVDKNLSVNKIGHGLHHLDEEYKKVTHHPKVQALVKRLGYVEPTVNQSMVIFKQPHYGGIVVPHQDGSFLINSPMKVIGVWIALVDTSIQNACLSFISGSHHKPITRKMVVNASRTETTFTAPADVYDDSKFVPVPVKKGSAIIIHSQVVHKSGKNTSTSSREVYTFHIAESKDTVWSEENWLQPNETYQFPLLYT